MGIHASNPEEILGPVLFERGCIADRVRAMGVSLTEQLLGACAQGEPIVFLPVMTGAFVFAADLAREMALPMRLEAVTVRSYRGASTVPGDAVLRGGLPEGLAGAHVVLVDDILDTGQTLALLQRRILEQSPVSLRTVVLLRKIRSSQAFAEADCIGFDTPDVFVVGYGLDYDGRYRNLPDIHALEVREVGFGR